MTQRKGLRGILALLCAMTLLIGAIGPAWATEAAPLTDGGTQEVTPAPDGNTPVPTGETPTPAPQTKPVVASWSWVDPDKRVNQGVMEVSDKEGPVDYSGVTVLLPAAITAQVEGQSESVSVAVTDWLCPEFDASVPGEYTFKAQIAQDYTLGANVPALEVKVKLIHEQPNTPADTTGNTTAPAAPTPPAAENVSAPECSCEIRCTQDSVKADCPVCSAEGAKLDVVCTGAAPVTLEEKPQTLANGMTLVVGNQNITTDGYWTTDSEGKLTAASEENWNVHYDTASNTLILKDAVIVGDRNTEIPFDYKPGISVVNETGNLSFSIQLVGNNVVSSKVETSITVENKDSNSDSTVLNVEGNGRLKTGTLYVASGHKKQDTVTLSVQNHATIEAAISIFGGQWGDANIVVDNSALMGGEQSIIFVGGAGLPEPNNPVLTLRNNAFVQAARLDAHTFDEEWSPHISGTGIVFDGEDGTVYGNVTLDGNLVIGEGKILTIPDGAALTNNGTLTNRGTVSIEGSGSFTNNGTINNSGTLPENVGGTINQAPKITTESLPDGAVGAEYSQTLAADGKDITWSTRDTLPAGLSLSADGKITGTPTTAGDSTFTVTATNSAGSDSKQYTIKIADTTAPQLKAGTVNRTSDANANVTFTVDEAGTYFYKVVDSGAAQPTDITSGNGTAMVSGENTITLTGLTAGAKDIYIVAKDAANNKSNTLKISIPAYSAPVYSITTDPAALDFGTAYSNYTAKAKTVTIKNTGNQSLTLNQPASTNSFVVGTISETKLPAGGTVTFTVQPKPGLTAGTYDQETIKISGTNGQNTVNASVSVKFTVKTELQVKLTAANFTTTYNGSAVFPEAIHKTATCDGQAVSGTWSFVGGNPKNAGTYKDIELKFTPKDTEKYAAASIKLDVVIKKAPLKVSVKLSKTKIAVNSTLPTVSLSYSGLMGNDKMQPKVEPKFEGMPSGKKTGTYTISLKNVDEVKEAINDLAVSKNYDITYVTSAKLSVVSGTNPLTADTSNIQLWTAIMIISGIGLIVLLVVMVVLNKKNKRRRRRRTPPKMEE